MAQWQGYASGNTHATRVEDSESALRLAVDSFRLARTPKDRTDQAKRVRRLAKRVLWARLRPLKARSAAAKPLQLRNLSAQGRGTRSLEHREAKMREEGIKGILIEFNAQEALI